MAQKRRSLDEHKRCVKARHSRDAGAMTTSYGPSRPISKKSALTKSKSTKIRDRSDRRKFISADSTGSKEGTTSSAGRAGSSLQRAGSVKPSIKKAAGSSSDSERSDDEDWAASDSDVEAIIREEPKKTRKTRGSMTEENIGLVTKMFDIRREMTACTKTDCDAQGILTLNGRNHMEPMLKLSKCSRKTSEWQLASLLGVIPDSSSTPIEPPATDPLEAFKAANTAMQKTNQE